MHTIDDEVMRAKTRKLRVSTFADIFYEIVNDEAYCRCLTTRHFPRSSRRSLYATSTTQYRQSNQPGEVSLSQRQSG